VVRKSIGGKAVPVYTMKKHVASECVTPLILKFALDGGLWVSSRSENLLPLCCQITWHLWGKYSICVVIFRQNNAWQNGKILIVQQVVQIRVVTT